MMVERLVGRMRAGRNVRARTEGQEDRRQP